MGSDLSLLFLESSAVPDGPERIVYVLRNNEYVRQNGSGQEYLPTSAVFRAQAPPSLEHADVRIAPGRVHAKSVEAIGGERERTVTIRAEVDAQQPIRVRVRKPIGGTDGVAGAGLGFGDDGVVLQSGLRQVWHSKAIRLNASSFATETQLMILVQSVKEGRPAIEECTLVKLVCTGGAKPAYHAEVVEQYVSLDGIEYKMNELYGKTKGISGTSEELGEPVFANEALCVVCLMEDRDTAIIPCRHLCLCSACSDIVRLRSQTCPICRHPMRSLLQIDGSKVQKAPSSTGTTSSNSSDGDGSTHGGSGRGSSKNSTTSRISARAESSVPSASGVHRFSVFTATSQNSTPRV
jgi:hypothetical protein